MYNVILRKALEETSKEFGKKLVKQILMKASTTFVDEGIKSFFHLYKKKQELELKKEEEIEKNKKEEKGTSKED